MQTGGARAEGGGIRHVLNALLARQVVSIAVKEGDEVEEGQQLAVVEAMKMQNVLKAENAGRVAKLKCKPGDTLRVDAVMMEFQFD